MKQIINPIKGTRDFYPESMAVRTWLYSKVKLVSERFGYQEYEGPFLEPIALYAAKSGEELVKEQSFVFPDRSGDLITLRPELTPTLARMVAQKQKQLIYPLRWWSFGPFWRYEKPQKGRSREFFQWNIDLIGMNTPESDAELIAVIATFFREVGLNPNQVKIFINDRELMESELSRLDILAGQHSNVFRLIDRKEKMSLSDWEAYARDEGLTPQQIKGILDLLQNRDLWKISPNLTLIFEALDAFQAKEFVEYDPNIIRGLDYYTSTVFEAKDMGGEVRRSILGGGRYNNLLSAVGGEQLPAVGFAMGDVVITLILESYGLIPSNIYNHPAQILITSFSSETIKASISLSVQLRKSGINVLDYPEAMGLNKQLKYADKLHIPYVAIIGPDELDKNVFTLKELASGKQIEVPLNDAEKIIPTLLASDFNS
jgi:histidyl-tRNA synthetase